jgi:hypothetical protein
MGKLENVQTYYLIYSLVRDTPRYKLKPIARALGLSGRGHSYTTASNYIKKLYIEGISLYPNLILRNFENCYTTAYFLKVDDPKNTTSMFLNLSKLTETDKISYMLLLSGRYDFFVTSKYDFTFDDGLTVEKKSILYNPMYTNPSGWDLDMADAFKRVAESDLEKGTLQRDIEDFLFWEDTEFCIFETMKNNVQISFTEVARRLQYSPNTVRKYYYNSILPCCDIAHYFFPKGYDHYHQSLILLKSDYEKGLVKAFSKLPCTTYVFPLEDEMVSIFFHKGVDDLMFALKKLEEKGYIEYHLLLVPLYWD